MNDLDEGGYAIHKEDPYELIEAEYANIIDNIDTHVPTGGVNLRNDSNKCTSACRYVV